MEGIMTDSSSARNRESQPRTAQSCSPASSRTANSARLPKTPALAATLDASHGATPPENLLSVSCPWTERYPIFAYVTSDGV